MLKYTALLGVDFMNNLVLAYLGDSVYEVRVREYLINRGISKVKELQKSAVSYVSAKAQAKILEDLIEKSFLTEAEIDIIKRGRNAHSHSSKSTDIVTYKKATGFETLIGYLYLHDINRLNEIMEEILK